MLERIAPKQQGVYHRDNSLFHTLEEIQVLEVSLQLNFMLLTYCLNGLRLSLGNNMSAVRTVAKTV